MSREFEGLYAKVGRPSVPPERLLRAQLLQVFYSNRSERLLMEQLDYNLLFRWFLTMTFQWGKLLIIWIVQTPCTVWPWFDLPSSRMSREPVLANVSWPDADVGPPFGPADHSEMDEPGLGDSQKQLRLREARQLMLNENLDPGSAASASGYENASQLKAARTAADGAP